MTASTMKTAAGGLLLLLTSVAQAGKCLPEIRDGWLRLPPAGMGMPMMAGFGRIENQCPSSVVVQSVRSPAFGEVSLHRTSVVDGISRMRPVTGLPIGAGEAATLQPGGLHLMLMQPAAPLEAGAKVQVYLQLQDGREVRGDFVVRNAAE